MHSVLSGTQTLCSSLSLSFLRKNPGLSVIVLYLGIRRHTRASPQALEHLANSRVEGARAQPVLPVGLGWSWHPAVAWPAPRVLAMLGQAAVRVSSWRMGCCRAQSTDSSVCPTQGQQPRHGLAWLLWTNVCFFVIG